jgi:hypothetical protein
MFLEGRNWVKKKPKRSRAEPLLDELSRLFEPAIKSKHGCVEIRRTNQ